MLIKDTQAVAGVTFTAGSAIFKDRVPEVSDPIVVQIEAQGGIVCGKTNVPEFAAGSQSFNALYPTSVSPYDTRTTAGGSSGGAASALSSRQVWLASGSDLGGSLRTPAAFCGCVGFRFISLSLLEFLLRFHQVSHKSTSLLSFAPRLGWRCNIRCP